MTYPFIVVRDPLYSSAHQTLLPHQRRTRLVQY